MSPTKNLDKLAISGWALLSKILMSDFILPIFPEGSLASSIATTVWIGVTVSAMFNLRFGWSLSGLVVPGYLVPLLILRPWSAMVVIFEGVLTYIVVWFIFEYVSRGGVWNSVFGRDRFFALLLFSVIIRITLDGWILPIVGEWINQTYDVRFDYMNNLHSFGLIIVALIANQFWKPGLLKGTYPFVVTVGLTYFIVRHGLMAYTNFTISNLSYMYEDIAASMLASPKAYIILLTTAYIASHMNLQYGWEYSGILIPSLLATLWYQPIKIFASLIETFAIIFIAILVLKLPLFTRTTIEGGRKILLFFNLSYGYKFILAYIILWLAPTKKITDFYGFGYLLPSLLAIKMMDKEIIARTTRVTLQTSLVAIVLASIIGFGLSVLPKSWSRVMPAGRLESVQVSTNKKTRLIDIIQEAKVNLYQNRLKEPKIPGTLELDIFSQSIRTILDYTQNKDEALLKQAQSMLSKVNMSITKVEDRFLYIHEKDFQHGRGIYIINYKTDKRMLIEVPAPLNEKNTMEAATWLFITFNARAIAIAGGMKPLNFKETDVLDTRRSFFHMFHRETAFRDVLQLRAYTSESLRAITGIRPSPLDPQLPHTVSTLFVKSSLPPGLHIGALNEHIGDFSIQWKNAPFPNIQRDITETGFAELYLNRQDIRKLFFKPILSQHEIPITTREQRIDGYLQDWLLSGKIQIAEKGSEKYVKPKLEELLFFDEEVLTPLIFISNQEYKNGVWTSTGAEELKTISAAADLMGYALIQYHHKLTNHNYLILYEKNAPDRRYWGTYVFHLERSGDYIIQIPRPLFEQNVFEYGVALFVRLNAKAILISGTHKDANKDGSSDHIRLENISNLFHLVGQVLLREYPAIPTLVIQTRARGLTQGQPMVESDMFIAFNDGVQTENGLSFLGKQFIDILKKDNISYRLVDGSRETAGYEVGGLTQAMYLNQTRNKELAILWISLFARTGYRQQTDNFWQIKQFNILGIPITQSYLQPYITTAVTWADSSKIPEALITSVSQYIQYQDIILLQSLIKSWPAYQFERFVDLNTRQAYLLIYTKGSELLLVANLLPKDLESKYTIGSKDQVNAIVTQYIDSRAAWLVK